MRITTSTLTGSGSTAIGSGRVGLENWIRIESERDLQLNMLFKDESTTQDFIVKKQVGDFGYPQHTTEGAPSYLDSKPVLYQGTITPNEFTLAFGITFKGKFTDQYGLFDTYKEDLRDAFYDLFSLSKANIFNMAFTTGYNGFDGVTLGNTAHPMKLYPTFSNRLDVALSYYGVQQGFNTLQKIKTARQRPMRMRNGGILLVPVAKQFTASAIANSAGRYDTANREDNQLKSRIKSVMVEEDLTSDNAWFIVNADKSKHGLKSIKQMPITFLEEDWQVLNRSKLMGFFCSFVDYWDKPHGVFCSQGQ